MKSASQHPAAQGQRPIDARRAKLAPIQPSPGQGYDLDDEVFFRGPGGPSSGRVVARGKHGCTIDEPCGKRHQVEWGGLLGLKTRKTYPARVVDRGSGGSILEREDGSRFYVAGDVPVPDEPDALSYDESGFINGEEIRKADAIERLGERIRLLSVCPGPRSVPAGVPLLWGSNVP